MTRDAKRVVAIVPAPTGAAVQRGSSCTSTTTSVWTRMSARVRIIHAGARAAPTQSGALSAGVRVGTNLTKVCLSAFSREQMVAVVLGRLVLSAVL